MGLIIILGIILSPTPMNFEVKGIIFFCFGPFLSCQNLITFKQNGNQILNFCSVDQYSLLKLRDLRWISPTLTNNIFLKFFIWQKFWFLKPKDTKSHVKRKMDEINEIIPVQCSKWFSSWHELTKQSPKNLKYLKL